MPVSARKRTGLEVLMHAVAHHKDTPAHGFEHHHSSGKHIHKHHDEYVMVYSDEMEDKIDIVSERLKESYPEIKNCRWHAIKIMEQDDEICQKYPIRTDDIFDKNYEAEFINQRYDFIDEIMKEVMVNKEEKSLFTDKIDAVVTHRIWGVPVFLLIMAAVFFLTFTVGDWLKGYFETALGFFSETCENALSAMGAGAVLKSLIVDGIIAGVGGILTFLPNIFILFLALAFLEDSGYMSRVAYVMDGIMGKIGLSGRAFIPMLLGFGCTVPAVMASRALEDPRDKIRTILVTPFMSCSARLPIYVLLSQMFFGKYAMIAAYSMYVGGVAIAILIALIIEKFSKDKQIHTLLIELPEYKTPNARTIAIYVWDKVKDYLTKAGTTIFVASIMLWCLLNFNMHGMTTDMSKSFAASIGRFISPVLATAGLGSWQLSVALISGIAAKEVVVSSLSVLYGIANVSSQEGMTSLAALLGESGFNAVNAYSMMLFCLLYIPCIASIATIRRETASTKQTIMSIVLNLGTAWVVSTIFYQIFSRIF